MDSGTDNKHILSQFECYLSKEKCTVWDGNVKGEEKQNGETSEKLEDYLGLNGNIKVGMLMRVLFTVVEHHESVKLCWNKLDYSLSHKIAIFLAHG